MPEARTPAPVKHFVEESFPIRIFFTSEVVIEGGSDERQARVGVVRRVSTNSLVCAENVQAAIWVA